MVSEDAVNIKSMSSSTEICSNKLRVAYIDVAKFVGILLLLLEHTGNFIDIQSKSYSILKIWICSFHMPLFFYLYGKVVNKKDLKSFNDLASFLYCRLKSLMVPYVLWSLIYAPELRGYVFKGILYGTNESLSKVGTNSVLWFLPAMFVSTIIYQLFLMFIEDKNVCKKSLRIALSVVLCLLIFSLGSFMEQRLVWSIDVAFLGSFFMLIGHFDCLTLSNRKLKASAFSILLVIGVLLALINQPIKDYWVTVMALAVYGKSILLFALTAWLGIKIIIILSHFLETKKPLQYLGRHSLLLMAVHYIIFEYSIRYISSFFKSIGLQKGLLFASINSVVVLVVALPICWIVDMFCPCLNGKEFKSRY